MARLEARASTLTLRAFIGRGGQGAFPHRLNTCQRQSYQLSHDAEGGRYGTFTLPPPGLHQHRDVVPRRDKAQVFWTTASVSR